MIIEAIINKFRHIVDYWYDFEVETINTGRFGGLRHPEHQEGAVIPWEMM